LLKLWADKVHRATLHDTKFGIFLAIKAFTLSTLGIERTFAWLLAKDFEKNIARGYD